jgi:hypothetical protein
MKRNGLNIFMICNLSSINDVCDDIRIELSQLLRRCEIKVFDVEF